MSINSNVLAEKRATVLSDDGNTMYATIQMRHGNEADMDKSKFVPAEMGVATNTKKAFMAFAPGEVKEIMFREDSEIEELLEEVRDISDQAVEAVESAEATAKQAIEDYTEQMKATIPEDYTEMVKKVDVLERTKAPAIYQTISGESLQIEDSADAPMAGLRVLGRSRQVVTTGAQLIPCPIDEELESYDGFVAAISKDNGIEVTLKTGFNPINSESDIYFAGGRQSNEESNYELQPQIPAGQYHLHIDDETFNSFSFYIIVWRNGGSNTISSGTTQDIDITIQENDKFRIFIRPKTGATTGTYTINPMLNAGSTALPWEPYTGGKPSPSPDYPQEIEIPGSDGEIELQIFSANIYNNSERNFLINIQTANILEKTDTGLKFEVIKAAGSAGVFKTDIFPNGFSGYLSFDVTVSNRNFKSMTSCLKFIGLSSDFDTGHSKHIAIKLEEYNSGSLTFYLETKATGTVVEIKNIMITTGNEDREFQPYSYSAITLSTPNGLPGIPVDSGGNYTDSDGQQWICDEIDYARGKYVQRVNYVTIDENTNITIQVINDIPRFNATIAKNPTFYSGKYFNEKYGKCNRLEVNPKPLGDNSLNNAITCSSNGGVFFRMDQFNDVPSLKAWLTSNPIKYMYVLASPIETDLSTEQLTAYAALRTNYPTTVVTSDSDPEVGIEVEYVADTQKYIDSKFAELAQNLAATQNTLLEV